MKNLIKRILKPIYRKVFLPLIRPIARRAILFLTPTLDKIARELHDQVTRELSARVIRELSNQVRKHQDRLHRTDQFVLGAIKSSLSQNVGSELNPTPADRHSTEASKQPLSGESLKEILNRELSYEGAIAKQGLWFNHGINVHYEKDFEVKLGSVNERIAEIPFVLSQVPSSATSILDLGSTESLIPLQIASSTNAKVVAVDLREYPFKHDRLKFQKADLRDLPFEDKSFDCVLCMSTIEHVGLGHYGDPLDKDGDLTALQEAHRVLSGSGTFIGTFPLGAGIVTGLHRIYKSDSLLEKLQSFFAPKEIRYSRFKPKTMQWMVTESIPELDTDSGNLSVQAVLMFCGTRK